MIKGYRVLYAPYPPRTPPPASAPPRARVSAVIGTSSAVTGLAAATNYSVQVLAYTVLYCTVLYCTVLYCIILYCTVLLQVLAYTAAGDGPLSAPVSCTTEPDGEQQQ